MRSPKPGVISLITLAVCLAAAYPSAAQMAGEPHLPPLYRFPDGHYVLADTLRYKINGHNFVIPPGFVNDLASIPRKSAGFLPRDTRHDIPGIVHDWLYWRQELPKKARMSCSGGCSWIWAIPSRWLDLAMSVSGIQLRI
jgi:hypothetical protein